MSDNLRRYRAIHDALRQGYPGEPSGNRARLLTTLATSVSFQNVRITKAASGSAMTIYCWGTGCQEPLYLVSNLSSGQEPADIINNVFEW